ncbi:polyprenyl synthetase family protein [Candidatus Bipolaricaulota bacterium]|nr:polyprenyl synthetase family protein [Candidatus Bipolaricaulota bacterium]
MSDFGRGVPSRLKEYREKVSDSIKSYLEGKEGKTYEMINYHLGFNGEGSDGNLQGKAIRSSIALYVTEALGGNPNDALPAALSLELIHNFSLVHDDIQDDDRTRRGRPTVQYKWNPEQAINTGDAIKDLSLLIMTDLSPDENLEKTLEALNALGKYSLRMIQGQVMDLDYMKRKDIDIDSYLEMIDEKTCSLMEAAFHIGGIYSPVGEEEIEKLISFGKYLGYVYQIRDDWLGIWGQPEESGKSILSDIEEKKRSFPVVYAFQESRDEKLSRLKELYYREGKLGEDKIEEVREILEEVNAAEKTNERAEKYWRDAERQLRETEMADWAKTELEDFGSFLLTRKK